MTHEPPEPVHSDKGTPLQDPPLPSLSVVMATYNGEATIDDQFEALASQEYPAQWEIVVADNGSTDGTRARVAAFQRRLPSLRVIEATGCRGPSHARNRGAAASHGDVLVFVDQDDQVAPGYLLALGSALRDSDFAASRVDHLTLNADWVHQSRNHWQADALMPTAYFPAASGCTLAVRRDAFLSVGGFDEEFLYAQDIDLCWRLQERGVQLSFVPGAVLRYRHRSTLWKTFDQERRWGTDDALLYAKHHRKPGFTRRSLRAARNDWVSLAQDAVRARDRAGGVRFIGRLGRRIGRVQGSVRYRVLFP